MTLSFAALGEFGDAISFIFTSRENQRGSPVGGSHNLPLIWEHLKLCGAAMALALVIALPLGLILGHTGKGSFLAISTSNVGRAVPSVGDAVPATADPLSSSGSSPGHRISPISPAASQTRSATARNRSRSTRMISPMPHAGRFPGTHPELSTGFWRGPGAVLARQQVVSLRCSDESWASRLNSV